MVASNGPYDCLGTRYFRQAEGQRFDRLRANIEYHLVGRYLVDVASTQ